MLADTQIYRRHDTEEPETIRSMASLSILNWLEPSKVQQSLAVTDGRFCQEIVKHILLPQWPNFYRFLAAGLKLKS